jgi:hypothetical protein
VGIYLDGTKFQSTSNTVGSIDLRYVLPSNWTLAGQATTTHTDLSATESSAGPGYKLTLKKFDNHFTFQSYYTDRSAGFNSTLGYINRTDIRRAETYLSYQWKPAGGQTLMAYGPFMDSFLTYDHAGRLQNWTVQPGFQFTLPRLTTLSVAEEEDYEFYQGIGFRESSVSAALTTSWFIWLDMSAGDSRAILPNYYPPEGLDPFLAGSNNAYANITLHSNTHLRLDQI